MCDPKVAIVNQSTECSKLIIPPHNCKTENYSLTRPFGHTTGGQASHYPKKKPYPLTFRYLKRPGTKTKPVQVVTNSADKAQHFKALIGSVPNQESALY